MANKRSLSKLSRKRASNLLKKIKESDQNISNIRKTVSNKDTRRELIRIADKVRRRGSSSKERLVVRFAIMTKIARRNALKTIKKSRSKKGGFIVKLGGPIRGSVRRFDTRRKAINSVRIWHDNIFKKRLGGDQVKLRKMKRLFDIR